MYGSVNTVQYPLSLNKILNSDTVNEKYINVIRRFLPPSRPIRLERASVMTPLGFCILTTDVLSIGLCGTVFRDMDYIDIELRNDTKSSFSFMGSRYG